MPPAGCSSSSSPPWCTACGCIIDELLKRTGTSHEALDRLDETMRTWQAAGGQPPAEFIDSARAYVSTG